VVLNKQARVWLGAWCYARIRCGFPVKKSISVRTKYRSGGRAVGISGCCAGAVVGAVRVQGCGLISKQGLGAGFLSKLNGEATVKRCGSCGAKRISKG
jgi:hypothetical protein